MVQASPVNEGQLPAPQAEELSEPVPAEGPAPAPAVAVSAPTALGRSAADRCAAVSIARRWAAAADPTTAVTQRTTSLPGNSRWRPPRPLLQATPPAVQRWGPVGGITRHLRCPPGRSPPPSPGDQQIPDQHFAAPSRDLGRLTCPPAPALCPAAVCGSPSRPSSPRRGDRSASRPPAAAPCVLDAPSGPGPAPPVSVIPVPDTAAGPRSSRRSSTSGQRLAVRRPAG